ncbi:MAG TPA: nuclear transport factor 2 family protein [Solirubrobacteraceae bacterium]|nr:nuclear transport factor 2 family protein [Solirubrobacteraceae bacterium]
MSDSNLELARRGYEAVSRGDFDAIRDLFDPDVKWHGGDPDWEGSCRNRDQALAFMRQARERNNPLGEAVDMVEAGDKVVVILQRTGEDGEPELVANLTTFRDGKVIEMVHYPNPDDALAAAGASG